MPSAKRVVIRLSGEEHQEVLKGMQKKIQQELSEIREKKPKEEALASFIKDVAPPDGSDRFTVNTLEEVLRAKANVASSLKGAWSAVENALSNWARRAPKIPDLPGFYVRDLVGFNKVELKPSTFWKLENAPLKLTGFQNRVVVWVDGFGARYRSDHAFVTKALGLGCITHDSENCAQMLVLQPGHFYTVGKGNHIDFPSWLVSFGKAESKSEEGQSAPPAGEEPT